MSKSDGGKALLRRMIGQGRCPDREHGAGQPSHRLGFDYPRLSALNPRLIFAQVKGFAPESEHANYLSFDMIAQAMGGTMGVNGHPRRATGPAGLDHRRYRHRHALRHGHHRRALPAHDNRPRPAGQQERGAKRDQRKSRPVRFDPKAASRSFRLQCVTRSPGGKPPPTT